ncbi:MAG TPA: hypothetical protein VMT85_12335 [Thermoanaerobaculia bacterium]|nr:hypothetical protein [Thermoanaerobaculia bacterium]
MAKKIVAKLGMPLLGVWLILYGLIRVLNLSFSGLGLLMGILAIVAGALILIGR